MTFPSGLSETAQAVTDYLTAPEAAGAAFTEAQGVTDPDARVTAAFEALKRHVTVLDAEGLVVLVACAEIVITEGLRGRQAEADRIRDAAIRRHGLVA